MSNEERLIKGVTVTLGRNDYVIPPLNFRMLQEMGDQIAIVNAGGSYIKDVQTRDAFIEVIYASIKRNYPNVSRDEVIDGLDVTNAREAMLSLLGISGFERKEVTTGEGTPMGESTGTASIAT